MGKASMWGGARVGCFVSPTPRCSALSSIFSALARHQRKRVEKIYGAQIVSVPTVQPKLPGLHGATAMRRPLARTRVIQGTSPASELSWRG